MQKGKGMLAAQNLFVSYVGPKKDSFKVVPLKEALS